MKRLFSTVLVSIFTVVLLLFSIGCTNEVLDTRKGQLTFSDELPPGKGTVIRIIPNANANFPIDIPEFAFSHTNDSYGLLNEEDKTFQLLENTWYPQSGSLFKTNPQWIKTGNFTVYVSVNDYNTSSFIPYRKILPNVNFSNGSATVAWKDFLDSVPDITIQNSTGDRFYWLLIKPASSSDWEAVRGNFFENRDTLFTLSIPPYISAIFDFIAVSANTINTYTKSNVTISNGMNLMFTNADADNPVEPHFITVHINNDTNYDPIEYWSKPSNISNWNFGVVMQDTLLSTLSLSLSPQRERIWDFRLRDNESGLMFTKYNVYVSEGMKIIFTGSDLEQ